MRIRAPNEAEIAWARGEAEPVVTGSRVFDDPSSPWSLTPQPQGEWLPIRDSRQREVGSTKGRNLNDY